MLAGREPTRLAARLLVRVSCSACRVPSSVFSFLLLPLRRALLALRRLVIAGIAALVFAGVIFFPFAGRYLVREDPLVHADAIFVLDGARAERWMEAADLYKAGYARVIAISPGRPEEAEVILRGRGIRFPNNASLARDALMQMGIDASDVVLPEGSVDNTAQEAEMLRSLSAARGWKSVLVITSKYHSRRAGFAFRREFGASPIAISLRTTRYDISDPEHWWRHRADLRYVLSELQKLLVYRLGVGG
jgi:uncharacterized SAM-binding protein YcdF (DUF218 family)